MGAYSTDMEIFRLVTYRHGGIQTQTLGHSDWEHTDMRTHRNIHRDIQTGDIQIWGHTDIGAFRLGTYRYGDIQT